MSTIGSAGSVSGLYQFFQGISANTATPTSATSTTSGVDGTTSTDASQTGQISSHHHHHGGGGGGAMFKQIQSAVTSALQSAQANGTDQDPNQVIEDAISSVLKNAGNGTSATGSTATGARQSVAYPDGDGDTDANGAAEGSESAKQSFFQGLQALGVDPQQFHQDFLAAVQNAQNGNVDPSTAFQSFPPGSGVDTFA